MNTGQALLLLPTNLSYNCLTYAYFIIGSIQMGQNPTDPIPHESISQSTHKHIEKRFIVTPHPVYLNNSDFKLLHQKITSKKYILRVVTIADTAEKSKMEEKIFQKIANKTNYLPKLEHYIFQEDKSYCGMTTKCYLFFQIGQFTTFREEILKQGVQRAPFTQDQLINGMQNILFGLLWLRFFKEPHQNINTLNIFYANGSLMLGDPLICPISNENPERYTSPERQEMIDGQIQNYDAYVSDVFGVGMCMLQALKMGKLDKIYKRNSKINMQVLIEQVSKCKYPKLKDILQRILIGSNVENRQYLLELFFKLFNQKLATSQASEKSANIQNKLHVLGGSKRQLAKPPQRFNNFITANQINQHQSIQIKHHHKPSIQFQNTMNQSKPFKPSISFNTLNSNPNTSSTFISKIPSNYNLPKNQYTLEFQTAENRQFNHYANQKNTVTYPFSRKETQKSFSVGKIIPTKESLATPIKDLNLNFENYHKNDTLPLSHTKRITKQDYMNKVYEKSQYNFLPKPQSSFEFSSSLNYLNPSTTSINLISSYNNYIPALKTDFNPSKLANHTYGNDRTLIDYKKYQPKTQNSNSSQFMFPKNNSPIKKYSDKYTDKESEAKKIQNCVEIYANKNQPQKSALINYNSQAQRQYKNNNQARQVPKKEERQKGEQEADKTTPILVKKKEENSAENPQSSANSDFSKIIDQNIMNLQHGLSAAFQNSIKSLQTKPITEFNGNLKKKQKQPLNHADNQADTSSNYCLQALPMTKSEIISMEVQSTGAKQNGQNRLILGYSQIFAQYIVKNSISEDNLENYQIKQVIKPVQQPPKTPIRIYNPNIQMQYNRTIPEQDPTQEQSLGQISPHKPKGQYRQLEYENGGKYCGFIYDNQRNGQGTFYYKDGGYYQGQWKENAMNGYGKLFYDDGSLAYDGQWHHDQFHGRGKVYNDNAKDLLVPFNYQTFYDYQIYWKLYDGELSHDLKQGYGKLVFSNNEFYLGKFRADKPEGQGQFHAKDKVIKGVWSQGKLLKQF